MTVCKLCGCSYERGPKRGSDSLILCDSCFEDFRDRVERLSESSQNLKRAHEDESVCRDCGMLLEYNDVLKGDILCKNCRNAQEDAYYLLSSASEKELETRLGELLREKRRSK